MKNTTVFTILISLFCISCKKSSLTDTCIEGRFPTSMLYKKMHETCYPNSLWVEVLNDKNLGRDLTLYNAYPILHPIPPTQYTNIVELIFIDGFLETYTLEELTGRKINFKFRHATKEEINQVHSEQCQKLKAEFNVPLLVVTDWSYDGCPSPKQVM